MIYVLMVIMEDGVQAASEYNLNDNIFNNGGISSNLEDYSVPYKLF